MKKIFLLLLFVVLSFAISESQAIEAIKQNPALLNTPQAQKLLQEKGLTKEQFLAKLNGSQNQVTKTNTSFNVNNVVTFPKESNASTIAKKQVNEYNFTTPLSYIPVNKLIKKIRSRRQLEKMPKLSRFCDRFFYNKNKTSSQILAVPDYYQLNPNDIVLIQIFGGNDKSFSLTVNTKGNIDLPVLGPVHVAGFSVKEVQKLLQNRLKPTYPNSKIVVNVKVNSFIQVTLTGYVKAPGVYNLNSVSTVKDLLITANGIDKVGSIRNVILKRNGKILKIIDFYKLINNGEVVDNTLLKNGDIIYIPKAKKLVSIYGDVNIPAIYEVKNENLKEMINFAGGLKPDASKKFIKITRFINNSYTKVLFRNLNSNITLLNGDKIYAYKISELNKDLVYVYGNIEKPGTFEIPKDKKLATLLKNLNFLKGTYYNYALILHFDNSITSFNIHNPGNIELQPKDEVYIFNKYEIRPEYYVTVKGDVLKNPGKYRYFKGETLKDAINNAGLKEKFDKSQIQIVRYDTQMNPHIFYIDYEKNPNFKLQPFDNITLFKYTDFNPLKPISVYGEVNNPGEFNWTKNTTLKDSILMANWFKDSADKSHIEIVRYIVKNGERIRQIYNLSDKNLSFKIMPYDVVTVKKIPNWNIVKKVTISGEVKYPGVYVIKNGDTLYDLIKRAGGFKKDAYLYGAVFTRESVRKMQEKRLQEMIYKLKRQVAIIAASAKGAGEQSFDAQQVMNAIDSVAKEAEKLKPVGRISISLDRNLTKFRKSPYNITLQNGDKLYIPIKKDSVIVMGEVLNETAFVYTKKKAIYYINKAGGPTSNAGDIFFVVHANGLTEKGELSGWFRKSVKVKPGDVVTVPLVIKTSTWYGITKDITSILYQLAITAASLKTVGAF